MQAAKGHNIRAAEVGSEMDAQAIMQTKEIKAARLKDKSAMKYYDGDWQCQRIDRVSSVFKEKNKT